MKKSLQITYVHMVFGSENEFLLRYKETNEVFRCSQTHMRPPHTHVHMCICAYTVFSPFKIFHLSTSVNTINDK